MRLWHIDLIPYLPKSQLLAQWRELNSIFKKQDKHILINYVYDYPKVFLWTYTQVVLNEMRKRCYDIKTWDNYNDYFRTTTILDWDYENLRFKEHNDEYLTICYYNLKEKYIRGQKDFDDETWKKLNAFYERRIRK